jgi:pyrroloquinoline quinone biosynthesis protein B
VSGPNRRIAAFQGIVARRRLFLHINNSNPILLDDSPERAAMEAAGWEVAHDGLEILI